MRTLAPPCVARRCSRRVLDTCPERHPRPSASTPPAAGTACRSRPAKPSSPAAAAATQSDVAAGTGSMQVHAEPAGDGQVAPRFRTRTRKGETVFCRSETPTGSRMSVETAIPRLSSTRWRLPPRA